MEQQHVHHLQVQLRRESMKWHFFRCRVQSMPFLSTGDSQAGGEHAGCPLLARSVAALPTAHTAQHGSMHRSGFSHLPHVGNTGNPTRCNSSSPGPLEKAPAHMPCPRALHRGCICLRAGLNAGISETGEGYDDEEDEVIPVDDEELDQYDDESAQPSSNYHASPGRPPAGARAGGGARPTSARASPGGGRPPPAPSSGARGGAGGQGRQSPGSRGVSAKTQGERGVAGGGPDKAGPSSVHPVHNACEKACTFCTIAIKPC